MIGCLMRRLLLLLLLAITQVGAAPAPAPAPAAVAVERPLFVPLVTVIANPERYDGKLVTVEGFLNLEFEGDAIYPSRSDFDAMLLRNAIWVDGPKIQEPAARHALSGHYVFLSGRFDAHMHGHMGLFAGGLDASEIWLHMTRAQIQEGLRPRYRNLPWPLLILVLLPLSLLLTIMLGVRSSRSTGKPGVLLTGSVLLVASVVGVFSVCRLWETPLFIPALMQAGASWMVPPLLIEFIFGALALVASGLFAFRRNFFWCVVFATIQLMVPAVIEARAFWIMEAPFSIHSAIDHDYRWKRSTPSPAAGRYSGPDWIDPFAS